MSDSLSPVWSSRLRWTRICARSLHLVAICGLAGGVLWGVDGAELRAWWLGAAATGLIMAATFSSDGPGWLVEVRGLALQFKLVLLAVATAFPRAAVPLLIAVILIAGVVSHAPGRVRYRVPWRRPG